MVTEQEARDMDTAIKAFEITDEQAARAQDVIDLQMARMWYDTTIKPTLQWSARQPDRTQLTNTFADLNIIRAIRETAYRRRVIHEKIREHEIRVATIKSRL